MPRFTLTIDTGGAAFGEPTAEEIRTGTYHEAAPEIARILRAVADRIEERGAPWAFATILDVNGNDVGRYALKGAE